jgi:N-methylhydantoinase A/oxoprolinase/acetone carboxylase beta subunit
MSPSPYLLASDVGGTFTDLVLLDGADGSVRVEKVATTSASPAEALLLGVDAFGQQAGETLPEVRRVVHATTLVANTLVERRGARTALIVTEGFRDLLQLRRHTRVGTFDLYADPPAPLVPRRLTYPVRERVLADGKVFVPLEEAAVQAVAERLVADEVEAVAVVLLHSYVNPEHEERVGEILARCAPGVRVALSSRLLRRHMEYERASTTVASVYCAGRLGEYLTDLSLGLRDRGITAPLMVMSSSGGFLSVESALHAPVQMVESGPSAGATYAAELARRLSLDAVLAFDMGGTTAKACLIRNGRLPMMTEVEAARAESFRMGSGIPLQVSAVNLIEVGGGGGSIGYVDDVGLLRVGPASAGAEPGPACYLRGGTAPTVTDADLVLGHLAADSFLGGSMPLGEENARRALSELVAATSAAEDEYQAAQLVQEVVADNIAAAIRRHVIERGGDPEALTLVAFGGAGPVHAYAVAQRLGITRMLIPPLAGVLSAVGLLTARPTFRTSRTLKRSLDDVERREIAAAVADLRAEVTTVLGTVDASRQPRFRVTADCAYVGQSSTLPVVIEETGDADGTSVSSSFATAYQEAYGHVHVDVPVDLVTVTVEGWLELAMPELPRDTRRRASSTSSRQAWSSTTGRFEDFSVLWRGDLAPGVSFDGPLIVEETESTLVLDVGGCVEVDELGNLLVTVGPGKRP